MLTLDTLTPSHPHTLTHSHTRTLTHSHTHTLTPLTHSHTHTLKQVADTPVLTLDCDTDMVLHPEMKDQLRAQVTIPIRI